MGVDSDTSSVRYGAPSASRPYSAAIETSIGRSTYSSRPPQTYRIRSTREYLASRSVQRRPAVDPLDDAPKKRKGKRKSAAIDDGEEAGDAKPAKKKAKAKDEEKRLKRWRDHAPNAYQEIRYRALTQRMFVIDRQRHAPDESLEESLRHPTETLSIAGTTGNIYTITIDKKPTCDCPHAAKGNQCKHVVYALARVLRVPAHLEYQLAFLSSELREIFEKAPPLPSETAKDSAHDGNRKSLEGECPICCVDFEPKNSKEQVVYCKAACGNNIHKECFAQWAATKTNGNVPCPFCRTPWESDEDIVKQVSKAGQKNAEGYVNVAGQLGLSGQRDYSTYNEFWLRRHEGGRYWDG